MRIGKSRGELTGASRSHTTRGGGRLKLGKRPITIDSRELRHMQIGNHDRDVCKSVISRNCTGKKRRCLKNRGMSHKRRAPRIGASHIPRAAHAQNRAATRRRIFFLLYCPIRFELESSTVPSDPMRSYFANSDVERSTGRKTSHVFRWLMKGYAV